MLFPFSIQVDKTVLNDFYLTGFENVSIFSLRLGYYSDINLTKFEKPI